MAANDSIIQQICALFFQLACPNRQVSVFKKIRLFSGILCALEKEISSP